MLRTFELHEYRPKNGTKPHYVVAEKRANIKAYDGITTDGTQRVWESADAAAIMRQAIENEHGLDLYVLRMYADGGLEEVSWPKGWVPPVITDKPADAPGVGTW
jgi:hypothetical protein